MRIWLRICKAMLWIVLIKPLKNSTLKRISQHSSKKNLIRNIIRLGIASLEEILVLMLPTKQNISFTFIWAKLLFCFLNQADWKKLFFILLKKKKKAKKKFINFFFCWKGIVDSLIPFEFFFFNLNLIIFYFDYILFFFQIFKTP